MAAVESAEWIKNELLNNLDTAINEGFAEIFVSEKGFTYGINVNLSVFPYDKMTKEKLFRKDLFKVMQTVANTYGVIVQTNDKFFIPVNPLGEDYFDTTKIFDKINELKEKKRKSPLKICKKDKRVKDLEFKLVEKQNAERIYNCLNGKPRGLEEVAKHTGFDIAKAHYYIEMLKDLYLIIEQNGDYLVNNKRVY